MSEKTMMLGNQAIARGAYEAGVRFAVAYPGTPSTEITQEAAKFAEIHGQWAPNEKVALETAIGSAIAGSRTLCAMKHVGMNVAADPLFTSSYMGINAGLVIVVADDPGMHSSQDEQDSRFYARAAHLPMLEPSDSQEALDFVKLAFELSEKYDTPVLIRTTTRMAHSRGLVTVSDRVEIPLRDYIPDMRKNVMLPANARLRHIVVEKRENEMTEAADLMPVNNITWGDRSIGVVASGMAYQYVREADPTLSVLKLGMVNPLPLKLIREFAAYVDKLVVAEELEPIYEEQIKSLGIECIGRELFSRQGEFSTVIVRKALHPETPSPEAPEEGLPGRPPAMCPGCPHRATFAVLHKLGLTVTGDIGCYTLGALPPLSAMHTSVCMGSSITVASGMEKARGRDFMRNVVSVIGDSTFFHSGMTGLVDMVYNGSNGTVLILDNSTTGMTGHQDNPGTGKTLEGEYAPKVDFEKVCRALGVESVTTVDPFDMKALEKTIKIEKERDGVSVIICRHPCVMLPGQRKAPLTISDKCKKCGKCLTLGCPAIEKRENGPFINTALCAGCGLCASECPFNAIGVEV